MVFKGESNLIPGIRPVPRTGVINVMYKARELGYTETDKKWSNLGQGSPETNNITGDKANSRALRINDQVLGYAPIAGIQELRKKVADYYNHFFRKGKKSQYSYKNVSIAPGGRAALTRIAASLGNVNVGHFIPDYTAYEELLTIFRAFIPIPTPLSSKEKYRFSFEHLKKEILSHGLSAMLLSNPCNPTGHLVNSERMKGWASLAKELCCTLIFDEFYSHYVYEKNSKKSLNLISAAEFVEDVNKDPIIIVDGLTKNWRLPGWRIGWIVGPEQVIDAVSSAGSFLDGGANHPLQQEALRLFNLPKVEADAIILQNHFKTKRDFMIEKLLEEGILIDPIPQGTFYIWANLKQLSSPINNGIKFFEECLKEKTIVVPGVFFDVNPGQRRRHSRYNSYVRLSFGPEMEKLQLGLSAIQKVIMNHSRS